MKTNILWIRNDLRLEDNTALYWAIKETYEENKQLVILFHINTDEIKIGTYSHDYFFSALKVFYDKIKKIGGDILFIHGNPKDAFTDLCNKKDNISKVFFNLSERGYGYYRDQCVLDILKKNNTKCSACFDKHLNSAISILTNSETNYKVFTPYYNKWMVTKKKSLSAFDFEKFKKVICSDFENPHITDFSKVLENRQHNFESICGEDLAINKLTEFIEKDLIHYEKERDNISNRATSNLSSYLSTGQISIRQIYYEVLDEEFSRGQEAFIRQLAWRDFYNMVYHFNPKEKHQEIISKYRGINWNKDKYLFEIWKLGLTGYPIIDAAMRHLRKTGTMHNRLRMIVASFLVKDLLIDWRMGEAYFKEMLLDYDSASNIGSWQWASSTGTDPCPYFRIFNPTSQSKKFDKNGEFIKENIHELKWLDKKYIHEPHKYRGEIQYPRPIVDHKVQRLMVLDMYSNSRSFEYSTHIKKEFIKRYIFYEFSKLQSLSKKDLIAFHSKNKYLYFTYDIALKNKLGSILAKKAAYNELYAEYKTTLEELLNKVVTPGNKYNGYEHIYGYFKDKFSKDEKEKYFVLIGTFAKSEVEEERLKSFFKEMSIKYDVDYIKDQTLINI